MPSAGFAMLAGAAVFGLATAYVWRRRANPGGYALMLILAAGVWYSATYALELSAVSQEARQFWGDVKYVGICLLPPAWVAFTVQYTGRGAWLTRGVVGLLLVEPLTVLTLLALPPTHDLVRIYPDGSLERFPIVGFGPVGWINMAYTYVLLLVSTGMFVVTLSSIARPYRTAARATMVALLVPFVFNLLYNFNIGPFGRVDLTSFAFVATALVLVWGIFRLRLLDIIPVARGRIVETLQDGVVVLDAYARVADLNPAAQAILRCTPSQVLGRQIQELMPEYRMLEARYPGSLHRQTELRLNPGPQARDYEVTLSPLSDGRGRDSGSLMVLRDISERKITEERLERLAHYDSLTGLPNRKLFSDRLGQAIVRARRNRELVGLLFMDVDYFKDVNDTLGHDIGDLLLQQLAVRVQGCVRAEDTVARLSGDEFTVILPQMEAPADAMVAATRILESLGLPIVVGGHELYVTASIGACVWPTDGEDPRTLLRNADSAMYRAKARGRSRIEFYAADLSAHASQRLEVERDLRRALEREELRVHYQPIVRAATGEVVVVEALLRWDHPTRGLLGPSQFLWRAEETGLIEPIGAWVLEQACRDGRRWRQGSDAYPVGVAVNVSARQLQRPSLTTEFGDVLDRTGLDAGCLSLEISESVVMEDPLAMTARLHDLRGLGIKLSLDDFGTGSTSLSQLRRFPLDVLKIDRIFVEGLGRDREDTVIVQAMLGMTKALGLSVVAEGVETEYQLSILRDLGCDLVQGFLYSKAVSPDSIFELVAGPKGARALSVPGV